MCLSHQHMSRGNIQHGGPGGVTQRKPTTLGMVSGMIHTALESPGKEESIKPEKWGCPIS